MNEKKSLEEQNSKLTLTKSAWVEPMRNWLKRANSICTITASGDLEAKKVLAKEIFGSNLFLKSQKPSLRLRLLLFLPLKTSGFCSAKPKKSRSFGRQFPI
jgi:hypothetical protein